MHNSTTVHEFAAGCSTILRCQSKGMNPDDAFAEAPHALGSAIKMKALTTTTPYGVGYGLGNVGLAMMKYRENSILDQIMAAEAPFFQPNLIGDIFSAGIIAEFQNIPAFAALEQYTLEPVKSGAITVLTKEAASKGGAEAESFRTRQVLACAESCSNKGFIESVDGFDDLVTITSSNDVNTDLATIFESFELDANSKIYLIVNPQTCANLAVKKESGQLVYPNLTPTGGELSAGIRVLATEAVGETNSGGANAYVVDAGGLLVNRGELFISLSEDADIQMSTAPTDPAGSNPVVSLFQLDLLALKVLRVFGLENFRTCVARIEEVNW